MAVVTRTPRSGSRPASRRAIVQERLGHSSVAITSTLYTHPGGDEHADAAASIAAPIRT